ncbi:hypothetical protein IIO_06404 [Bacillus cereus VD115]|nr:hypothetical protein IIO_06404 [Bacillus cereus VD115]
MFADNKGSVGEKFCIFFILLPFLIPLIAIYILILLHFNIF